MDPKPPNVLIYVGEYNQELVKNITVNLLSCLHPEKYVVYGLKDYQVLKSPWKECAEVLVVYCDTIENEVADVFYDYIESGGKILAFCSNLHSKKLRITCQDIGNWELTRTKLTTGEVMNLYHGRYNYLMDNCETLAINNTGESLIMRDNHYSGVLLASEVNFLLNPNMLPVKEDKSHCSEEHRLRLLKNILQNELGLEVMSPIRVQPTPGYILMEGNNDASLKLIDNREISLGLVAQDDPPYEEKEIFVPLHSDHENIETLTFDKEAFFRHLKTKTIGRTVLFFPVVTSTMIPTEKLKDHEDIVVIAAQQTSGRGRSDNVWISPKGCAMFSFPLKIDLTSRLGQRMSILQHMSALAVVHYIRKDQAYAILDLRLKWPNDIYFEKDKKIGGVLVNTTIQGGSACALIGIGVNVANHRPTVCINSVIERHNQLTGDTLPLIPTEQLIAGAITELQAIIDEFEKNGPNSFLKLYYKYWLHADQQVTISSLETEATIHGLDDYGFLIVMTVGGKRLTLQPDGNRFDMLKNLIVAKE